MTFKSLKANIQYGNYWIGHLVVKKKIIKDAKYYDAIARIEQLSISDRVLCQRKCHSDFIHPKSIRVSFSDSVNWLKK